MDLCVVELCECMVCVVSGLLVCAELLSSVKRTVARSLFILASLHIHTAAYVLFLAIAM